MLNWNGNGNKKIKNNIKLKIKPAFNSRFAQLGFEANFKVGFVLGSWFLIQR